MFTSFGQFVEHVGKKPDITFSLDRIDNNGHYELGNVRWADKSEQCRNQRKRSVIENFTDAEILDEISRRGFSL